MPETHVAPPPFTPRRETTPAGDIRLVSERCVFHYHRLRLSALLIAIDGYDRGQFGAMPLDEIAAEAERAGAPALVFVDARRATGPATVVMEMLTAWLAANRAKLEGLVVLIPEDSKLLHLTVSIAQHLSRVGNLLQICSTDEEFEAAMRAALQSQELRRSQDPRRPDL